MPARSSRRSTPPGWCEPALHGFAILEAADGFGLPREVTRSYHFLVDTLITGLQADPDDSTPPEDRHDRRPPTREHPETTR
ncbi:TetR-like C-terminal domain-containing protein [Streptomyces sp. NPDC056291]|uniref:TetR-like C-terminal domain-containing protein n=1 Tax=Streptomyces sp. NPDC056291 TaxID=3345772 RepID=UPI0035D8C13D